MGRQVGLKPPAKAPPPHTHTQTHTNKQTHIKHTNNPPTHTQTHTNTQHTHPHTHTHTHRCVDNMLLLHTQWNQKPNINSPEIQAARTSVQCMFPHRFLFPLRQAARFVDASAGKTKEPCNIKNSLGITWKTVLLAT